MKLKNIFGELKDPLYKNYYAYSTTPNKTEYQLGYVLEQQGNWLGKIGANLLGYTPEAQLLPQSYAAGDYSLYNPLLLNPAIWLDARDLDGDGNEANNPALGSTITQWVNKWTRWVSGDAQFSGNITYELAVNDLPSVLIQKADGILYPNSSISQGEIYYVLHDSGGKARGTALQASDRPNYIMGSYQNYRNSLNINGQPNHLTHTKNTLKRQAFFYSYITDGSVYEFRNTGYPISFGSANSIDGITWAMNDLAYKDSKKGNSKSDVADWWVGEFIVFDAELSQEHRYQIEWYLAHKWGLEWELPETHPYKYTPPTSITEEIDQWSWESLVVSANEPVFIEWNYNGLFTHNTTASGSHNIFVVPSIIAGDISSWNYSDILNSKALSYTGYGNIPAAYTSDKLTHTWSFDAHVSNPLAFSWSREQLASYTGIEEIDTVLRNNYDNSVMYSNFAGAFDSYGSFYVENILASIIGINPIKPYYCNEILEKRLTKNIAPIASIDASPTGSASWISGTGGIVNGVYSLEWNLNTEYKSADAGAYIEFSWEEEVPVWFVRIYNTVWALSDQLKDATLELYDADMNSLYSLNLWDTTSNPIVDIDLEKIGEMHDVAHMYITASSEHILALREVQIFVWGNVDDGYYKVDSDGIWGKLPYTVYCDMTTDGGGWTKVGENFIDHGSFEWGVQPNIYTGDRATGYVNNIYDNTILSWIAAPSEFPWANILRLSGGTNSYYQLKIEDIPELQNSAEGRISFWVKWISASPLRYGLKHVGQSLQMYQVNAPSGASSTAWRKEEVRIPLGARDIEYIEVRLWEGISSSFDITGMNFEIFYR